jgi:hypothetical protein
MAKKNMNNYQGNTSQKMDVTNKQQVSPNMQSGKSVAVAERPSARQTKEHVAPTYEQIAERAKSLWYERGCQPNQDEKNWYDAENQLKQEHGIY